MALVLLSGFPASGKSTVATYLQTLLQSAGREVRIISDGQDFINPSPHPAFPPPTLSSLYQDSLTEKKTRARLRAATERSLNPSCIVIVDSLNYIKGFRYEMFCVAKTSSTKYCVVYCEQDAAACQRRDAERIQDGSNGYGHELCEALIQRFEQPMQRCRWDRPLYHVDVFQEGWKDAVLDVKHFLLSNAKSLAPTMATRIVNNPGSNVLGMMDRVTRQVENAVIAAIQGGAAVGQNIAVPKGTKVVRLERKPKVAEVRGIRRSYLNLARMQPGDVASEHSLVDEYIDYINAQLKVNR